MKHPLFCYAALSFFLISSLQTPGQVRADEMQEALCQKGKSLVDKMVKDPKKRVSAWKTWAPKCQSTGYYEYELGRYHVAAGNWREALMVHRHGLQYDGPYYELNKRAVEELENKNGNIQG